MDLTPVCEAEITCSMIFTDDFVWSICLEKIIRLYAVIRIERSMMMMWQRYWMVLSFLSISFCKENRPIALVGTVLLPDRSIANGTILIIDGIIAALGNEISVPIETKFFYTNGIILPGLIDLHNHLVWNVFPRWKPMEEFHNRYEWQNKSIYKTLLTGPRAGLRAANLDCEMQRYAEVKAISQGATSLIGSLLKPCNRGLARNLDDDLSLGRIRYEVFPLQMSETDSMIVKDLLSSNGSLFVHLAEGKPMDASTTREFSMFKRRDLLRSGVSIIHGVGLKEEAFIEMANTNVGLVWSPRSNLELYGDTVDIRAALNSRVTIAIAPDWSPTGSDGLLSELNYASAWISGTNPTILNDVELVKMATINAAKLARLDHRLGLLKEGYLADLLVLRESNKNPFWSVTHAIAEDVLLVMIDGNAIYGDPDVMKEFVHSNDLETLEICGIEKSLSLINENQTTSNSFQKTRQLLDDELRRWGRRLAPLSECGH